MGGSNNHFWARRVEGYDQQRWVKEDAYLRHFLDGHPLGAQDLVLDIGTGTGVVARALGPYVRRVVGIDASPDMLRRAVNGKTASEEFMLADARSLPFPSESLTRLTARMVFHHIVDSPEKAMAECYRVLRRGGIMLLSEGVPPDIRVKDWYVEMFKLVEERLTFMEDDLVSLMCGAGFREIETRIYVSRQCSVRDWLAKCRLPQEGQEAVMEMHLELDDYGKKCYRMVELADDVLIDMKFAIVTGRK